MAKLNKLNICGIRNFDPNDEKQLKFDSPVTLILGQNGCGKTTIIESIKYGLTGELPTNTKNGQGFVNDPKMTNKQLIKGSIKVQFHDCKGNDVTIARFVQVQRNYRAGSGLQFKSLNPTVRLIPFDAATAQDVSGRCVDVNDVTAQYLKVSPAILNNVLFCHQENSFWPLDEAKKLKEKFDEIFDSVRYNKVCDDFRLQMRTKASQLKVLKSESATKEELHKHVKRQQDKLAEYQEKMKNFKDDIAGTEGELASIEARLQELLKQENEYGKLQAELSQKEQIKKVLQKNQATLRASITTVFEGTDDELNKEVESFNARSEETKELIGKLEQRKLEMQKKSGELADSVQKCRGNIGKFEQQIVQYRKTKDQFKELLNSAKASFDLPGDIDSSTFLEELNTSLNQQEIDFKNTVEMAEVEEMELQAVIDEKRSKHITTEQQIEMKTSQIGEIKRKIGENRKQQEDLQRVNKQFQNTEQKMNEIEEMIKRIKTSFNEDEKQNESQKLSDEINKLDRVLEKLEKDYATLKQNQVAEERIEAENEAIMNRQLLIAEIKEKNSSNLSELEIGEVDSYQKAVLTAQQKEENEFKKCSTELNRVQREITTLETTIKHDCEKINTTEEKLRVSQGKVAKLTHGKLFTDVLNTSKQQRERLQKNRGQFSSAKIMYETFIESFQQKEACCPVCQTNFTNRRQIEEIVTQLSNKITNIPSQLRQTETDLNKEEEFYAKLQEVNPLNQEIEQIETGLPQMKNDLNLKQTKLESLKANYQRLKAECDKHEILLNICKAVVPDAALIDQYALDIETSGDKVNELKGQIVEVYSKQTRLEVESEIEQNKLEYSELKMKKENLAKAFDNYRARADNALKQKQSLVEKFNQLQINLRELAQLEKYIQDYTEEIKRVQNEVNALKSDLNGAQRELLEAQQAKERQSKESKTRIAQQRAVISQKKNVVERLKSLQANIKEHMANKYEEQLIKEQEELNVLQNNSRKLESSQKVIIDAIADKKEQLANNELSFRDLNDNLKLRGMVKEEENLYNKEIVVLRRQMEEFDYPKLAGEKGEKANARAKILETINKSKGQIDIVKHNISDIQVELNKPQYKNAKQMYFRKVYETSTTTKFEQDLWHYVQALEKVVIDFHKEKMKQINAIIRELWRSIYRGNDIDHIEIQTEDEGNSTKTKRNFSYKVMQVNKGVEMDMRGRCSAGQRVLACLVIRIALSEALSSHCGMLALDEPTTNLDHDNIVSLAETLGHLISKKKDHKNFQMIIITHDSEFLQILTRSLSVDHVWKVTRDVNGFSMITRESL